MKNNLAVILGSGASFDSGYKISLKKTGSEVCPPTDLKFFREIDDSFLQKQYYALWKFRNLYFAHNEDVRMEDVWTAINLNHKHITLDTYAWTKETDEYQMEQFRQSGMSEGQYSNMDMASHMPMFFPGAGLIENSSYNGYKFLGDCERDFRTLVYDVYSSYTPPQDIDNFKLLHAKLMDAESCKLVCYITFNYDCYLENALTPLFKYISSSQNVTDVGLLLHGEIPIIKLHGSLNWEEKVAPRRITFHAPPYKKIKQVKPQYISDGNWSQPAIIPPTIFKQEINDDARAGDILTQTILQQWRAAIKILQEVDKIIFIGYSFPPTDYHARRIFYIARMTRKQDGKGFFKILYCGGNADRRQTISQIFGDETEITIKNTFSNLCNSDELTNFLRS